jgi:hypothetical protein
MIYFIGTSRRDGRDHRAYWLKGPEVKGTLQNLVVPPEVEEAAKQGAIGRVTRKVFGSEEPNVTVAHVATDYSWNNRANDLDREIYIVVGKSSSYEVIITAPNCPPKDLPS